MFPTEAADVQGPDFCAASPLAQICCRLPHLFLSISESLLVSSSRGVQLDQRGRNSPITERVLNPKHPGWVFSLAEPGGARGPLYGGVGQRWTQVDIECDSHNDSQPSGSAVCQKQSGWPLQRGNAKSCSENLIACSAFQGCSKWFVCTLHLYTSPWGSEDALRGQLVKMQLTTS